MAGGNVHIDLRTNPENGMVPSLPLLPPPTVIPPNRLTRSELIFRAAAQIPSRFMLVRTVARATRLLHKDGTRIGQTINEVLDRAATETLTAPNERLRNVAILEEVL